MMRIFDDQLIVITGGAGFIGSAVVRQLNERGIDNLVLIDDLGRDEKWKNLSGKRFLDLIPIQDCFAWLRGRESEIEAFLHLGALTSTLEGDADRLLEQNYRFSVRLAEYALAHGHRFIYASSAATYGGGSQGFSDEHDALDQLRPLNKYGYSKHLFDLWLKNRSLLDQVTGLKYFNVFGPNEYHKGRMASAVFHFLAQIQRFGVVSLFKSNSSAYADGEQKRDFIYVKDAARITCSFLDTDAFGIYNVGSGRAESWNRLAHAVFQAVGEKPNVRYIEMPEELQGAYQNYTCAETKKLKKALGERADCLPLEEAVVDYVKHYLIPGTFW